MAAADEPWRMVRLPPGSETDKFRAAMCRLAIAHDYYQKIFAAMLFAMVPDTVFAQMGRVLRIDIKGGEIARFVKSSRRHVWLMLLRNADIVGFVIYTCHRHYATATLMWSFVVPEWRELMTRRLLAQFEHNAALDGCTRLRVESEATVAAMRFYMASQYKVAPPILLLTFDNDGGTVQYGVDDLPYMGNLARATTSRAMRTMLRELETVLRASTATAAAAHAFLLACDAADAAAQAEFDARYRDDLTTATARTVALSKAVARPT